MVSNKNSKYIFMRIYEMLYSFQTYKLNVIMKWTLRICEWWSAFSRTFFSRGFCPTSLLCLLCSSPSLAPYRGWFPVISSLCCSNFVYFYTFNSLKAVWVKGQHSTTGKDLVVGFVAGNFKFSEYKVFLYFIVYIVFIYPLWGYFNTQ